ncbi:MAG: ABC transporter permease [Rhodobacteraceae bacterium]|nr:ABC transporter permease [Paracoccaceae bacterium]
MTDTADRQETGRLRAVSARHAFPSLRTVVALVLREMATTYGRSPGGYLWTILEPVAGIALLTIAFSFTFVAPPIGSNFAIFYATGMIPFVAYLDMSAKIAMSIEFSRPLLSYPRVTFLDALIGRIITNGMTQLLAGYILFTGMLLAFDTRTSPDLPQIALAFLMTVALAAGVGTMNCFLMSMFPVWQKVWAILNRPLFIVSCVFFVFEGVPEPLRSILWFNPLVHIVGQMRHGFYPSYEAAYVSVFYVFSISLGLIAMGLLFLRRYHRDILNY